MANSKEANIKVNEVLSDAMLDIYTSYSNRLDQSYLFDREMFDEIKTMKNMRGQVYLSKSQQTILNDQHPVYAFNNSKLGDVIKDIFEINAKDTPFSKLKNPRFIANVGKQASAIYLENSFFELGGSD